MKKAIKKKIRKLPYFKNLYKCIDELRKERDDLREKDAIFQNNSLSIPSKIKALQEELDVYKTWVPPGHFYSPLADLKKIREKEERIFDTGKNDLAIDLNEKEQLEMLDNLSGYYADIDYPEKKNESCRYFFDNGTYCHGDAIFLNMMIRYIKPKKLIEIGSGYSSCVTLDVNEKYFDNKIDVTFIEPYPDLLHSLISDGDKKQNKIKVIDLQEVSVKEFEKLESGDILFIDSTHVSKVGSDVNYVFFEILPRLKKGVYIHFHDIFASFEYPKEWVYNGWAWNEDYLLRAFLQYNKAFKIVLFLDYLQKFHKDNIQKKFPLSAKNGGGGMWLLKTE